MESKTKTTEQACDNILAGIDNIEQLIDNYQNTLMSKIVERYNEITTLRDKLQTPAHFLASYYFHVTAKDIITNSLHDKLKNAEDEIRLNYLNTIISIMFNTWAVEIIDFKTKRDIVKYGRKRFITDIVDIINKILTTDRIY